MKKLLILTVVSLFFVSAQSWAGDGKKVKADGSIEGDASHSSSTGKTHTGETKRPCRSEADNKSSKYIRKADGSYDLKDGKRQYKDAGGVKAE